MTGYELSKAWFKWCKANRGLVTPNHHALYFSAINYAGNKLINNWVNIR